MPSTVFDSVHQDNVKELTQCDYKPHCFLWKKQNKAYDEKTQYALKLYLECSIWINNLWETALPLISCIILGKLIYLADVSV